MASGGDVEEQQPAGVQATKTSAVANGAPKNAEAPKESAFKRFLSGPYFEIIPKQYERMAHHAAGGKKALEEEQQQHDATGNDYLGKLKRNVTNPVDRDGTYGLEKEELVPLPFDVPMWHAYLVEILSGVYLVAQATIVMFIAIYVENQERAWKSGGKYTSHWQPLVKALIIIYPLVTLIILVSFTVDYAIRKFMYFRLLSMRILVDWKNNEPLGTVFFWYFVATWGIMNAWAIYGVAKYYKKDGNDGVDPVSFGTFVVVNLQTIQLLLYYFKLLSTESRLVSLNQIFERAPVEAQRLLEFTYVIEEEDLVDECYGFALKMQKVFLRRMLNIISCCCLAKNWRESEKKVYFDIERLKRRAPNYKEVERNARELREEELKAGGGHADKAGATKEGSMLAPEQMRLEVDQGRTNTSDPEDDTQPPRPDFGREPLSLCGCRPLRWAYNHCYASLHSLHVSVMHSFHSWPFRPDIPYFRFLTLVQLFGILAVGAIVVLGWVFSTSNTNCNKATKTCTTCLAVHERYFLSNEPACPSFETAIAGIVASTNGTWYNQGVLEERYCNWACYGNFTPSQSCPPLK